MPVLRPPIARPEPMADTRISTGSGKFSAKRISIWKRTWRGPPCRLALVRMARSPQRMYWLWARWGAVPPGMGVVEGGTIPYLPAALKKRDENRAKWITSDPEMKCYMAGVPRATYMPYPFQIFQNASTLFIAYEYAGAVRDIYLKDPGPAPVDSWMGQSVGHWEGETLVVDVTGMNEDSWLDRSGNFHSDKLHVVERYTRTSPDVIMYEATFDRSGHLLASLEDFHAALPQAGEGRPVDGL